MAIKNGTNNNDNLTGNTKADKLNGLDGNDNLWGDSGNDTLNGGAGDDYLDGGQGADVLSGGEGNDSYIVDNINDIVIESAKPKGQIDTVVSYISDELNNGYVLGGNLENLSLGYGAGTIKGTGNTLNNSIAGNDNDNNLSGLAGHDYLYGEWGNDVLNGGSGNDYLEGGLGADSLIGETGKDTYIIDNVGDTVIESTLSVKEIDVAYVSIADYTLTANVENLYLNYNYDWAISLALNGTGNSNNNYLYGNAGANSLSGLEGKDTLDGGGQYNYDSGYDNVADTLMGGNGSDYYIVRDNIDTVMESPNNDIDTVESRTADYSLTDNVENLVLYNYYYDNQNGTGNALNNVLLGNGWGNQLNGLAGNDTLNGSGSSDTLNGGMGNDILTGGYQWEGNVFIFDSALDALNNVDQITDLSTGDNSNHDTIQLNSTIFSSLSAGVLADDMLIKGDNITTAADDNDYIIYNSVTGALYYDADANGAASTPVQFVGIGAGLDLNALNFLVV